ncbi:MAG TPA: histidine kinase [Nocardioides sp.]|nr:histidine kinase [Nocardioides sp.]
MSRLLSGWDALDPDLTRLVRFNLVALSLSLAVLATAYVLGFRHTSVAVDLAVMAFSLLLMLGTLPLTPRYGAPVVLIGLTLSAAAFGIGGTWATPNLSPLTALIMLIPMLVAIPYVSRRWLNALGVFAVVGSAGVAALAEWRRRDALNDLWWVNAIVVAASLPPAVLVVTYLVRDAYQRLSERTDQLRESRTRIVEVADAARRSIERDLHDGAQQRLLAMSVTIERARKDLEAGRHAEVSSLLGQLATDSRDVLLELRELARGIYPPLLTERGLVAALQATARRSVVPVTLRVADFPRPSPEVETAAYFCILEGLTNAARHSGCTGVLVELRAEPDLEFVVSDDGRGFDPDAVTTSGLLGMEARVAAAGGVLSLETADGTGTTLRGSFPGGDAHRRPAGRGLDAGG